MTSRKNVVIAGASGIVGARALHHLLARDDVAGVVALGRLTLPLARIVFSVVGKTSRYAPISADVIGKAIVRLAFDETAERVRVVESDRLHAIGS